MRIIIWFIVISALPFSAHALVRYNYYHVQSGTAFFVNRTYAITNAHVVKGCDRVFIKGAEQAEHQAEVKALDTDNDLALLETSDEPQPFAPLRYNIDDLKPGDKVLVIGYPGEEGVRGNYTVASAKIEDVPEEPGKKGLFYISGIVEYGNSGGPVLDVSGNVIGVIVAKTVYTTVNKATQETISEQHLGVVISLATLKRFLDDHGVYTEVAGSGLLFTDSYLTDGAKNYIVNVQCRQQTDEQGNLLGASPER